MGRMNVEITGTGSYIPEQRVTNRDFEDKHFYTDKGDRIEQDQQLTIRKFEEITGISERRYANKDQQTSDLAALAAEKALESADIARETLDGIIIAHNFGDIPLGKTQSDILPSLATRVKHKLGVKNPNCIAFDLLYGCPGWLQGVIVAQNYILAGQGLKYLVVGAETLSRRLDNHDRDSMIFSDGAGAVVVEGRESDANKGILSTVSQTFTENEGYYLYNDISYKPGSDEHVHYIKMKGRKIFEFGLKHVPSAMKTCMERARLSIGELKKILLHQANEKMDEAILKRFYKLYRMEAPEKIMPMSIKLLGNSSVATVPTLLDNLYRGKLEGHAVQPGDVIMMASVGAGMSINAITYRV